MTEQEYIVVRNLTNVRVAMRLLAEITPTEESQEVMRILSNWSDKLSAQAERARWLIESRRLCQLPR